MRNGLVSAIARLLGVMLTFTGVCAYADGTTERERTMSRYKNCVWTDAMSKEIYECVKRNDGFGTHWCFDETVQMNCEPEPLETAVQETEPSTK